MNKQQESVPLFERFRARLIDVRESTLMTRQRLIIFYVTILVTCFISPIYIWRFSYMSQGVIMTDVAMLLLAFVSAVLYMSHRITIDRAIYLIMTSSQVGLLLEIVCLYTFREDYVRAAMLVNLLVSLLFFVLTCCTYMKYFPVVMGLIGLPSAFITLLAMKAVFAWLWMVVALCIYLSCLFLSYVLRGNMLKTLKENELLKEEERQLLAYLHINRDELLSFIRFFKESGESESKAALMNAMGEEAKARIYSVVKSQMAEDMLRANELENVFPELTASQREIAQLILQGKSVGEIADILFKSVGNITSQRTHIRSKLGLKKEENLKDVLTMRMAAYAEKTDANGKSASEE